MCGRFIHINKTNSVKKKFNIKNSLSEELISYNISPSQISFIITKNKEINLEKAKWGYSFIDKKTNCEKSIINSRLETITDKILFKDSYYKRKCIIPANGYFEWSIKEQVKIPYFIHIPLSEPMYFAGIWKYINYKNNMDKVFTILTKEANRQISAIHHRMPVLLSSTEGEEYLQDKDSSYLKKNYVSLLEEDLDYYSISKFVNNPLNNSKECIQFVN